MANNKCIKSQSKYSFVTQIYHRSIQTSEVEKLNAELLSELR